MSYVLWGMVLRTEDGIAWQRKYKFQYELIGGFDPFNQITENQLQGMTDSLNELGGYLGVEFITDWAGKMSADHIEHYPWPRYLYYDKIGSGYRYWEALEYLKAQGVQHIVIAFPQITTDSVLNFIEVPNQIAREIGYKTYSGMDSLDFDTFPSTGHPFADHWGVWVNTECDGEPCCFEMGGCGDDRQYPPPRQTPLDEEMQLLDPSLAFDISEFGHCGYDPANGPSDAHQPVQDQYTGTWAMYRPPNDSPNVGWLLAKHVILHLSWLGQQRHVDSGEEY